MKRFYFLMLALLVAVAANAERWFISGGFQNWSHCSANYELKAVDGQAGVFRLECPVALNGEFLIVQGTVGNPDWNNKVGTNGSKVMADVPYKYKVGAGNFIMEGTVDKPTITLDTNAGTLLIAGQAKENEYSEVYLIGDFGGGWSETDTSRPLTLKEGTENVYEGTFALSAGTNYFKMKAGALVYGTGGEDVNVAMGQEYTASQTGSAFVIAAGEYVFTYTLDKNADTGVLVVTSSGNQPAYPETMYIMGNVDDCFWSPDKGVAMTAEGDGVYKAQVTVYNDNSSFGFFSFCVSLSSDWGTLGTRYGAQYNNYNINKDMTAPVVLGDQAFAALAAKYDVVLDLANYTLTLTALTEPVYTPESLYLLGTVEEHVWDTTASPAFTTVEGSNVFTLKGVNIVEDGGYCGFSLCEKLGDSWDAVNSGNRFGAPETNAPLTFAGNSVEATLAAYPFIGGAPDCQSFTIDPGQYDISVSFATTAPVMTVSKVTTGLEAVAVEAAPVEFFNLQGIRVAEPAAGIFIRRQGNDVRKVRID